MILYYFTWYPPAKKQQTPTQKLRELTSFNKLNPIIFYTYNEPFLKLFTVSGM